MKINKIFFELPNNDIDYNISSEDMSSVVNASVFVGLGQVNLDYILSLKAELAPIKKRFKKYIFFGIGGSCLGGKALCHAINQNQQSVQFCDSINPDLLQKIMHEINPNDTALFFISKSGQTIETISQFSVFTQYYQSQLIEHYRNIFVITENNSLLAKLADDRGYKFFPFEKEIGGRYSCFTNVTLIPAILANLDVEQYIFGAKCCLEQFANHDRDLLNSLGVMLSGIERVDHHIVMPYVAGMNVFNDWYTQLLAESCGKIGKGVMPISAIGSRDQHSMLQYFLDGKSLNEIYTIITSKQITCTMFVDKMDGFEYLQDVSLNDIQSSLVSKTIAALNFKKKVVRKISIDNISTYTIGFLNCYFIIEVILTCLKLNVNPFDQEAVEMLKIKNKTDIDN